MRRLLVVVILAVVVCSGLYLILHKAPVSTKTTEGAAKQFAKLLKAKDAAASYELLSDRYKKQVPKSQWNDLITSLAYTHVDISKTVAVKDPGAAYPKDSNPQKVIYDAATKDTKYDILIVLMTEKGTQKIDETHWYIK